MIAHLAGTIQEIGQHAVLLTVGGVGYEVFVPSRVLQRLALDQEAAFYVHHHIREDNQQLFGFLEKKEKQLFVQLIQHVSGVGPKIALAALGAADHDDLIRGIQFEDVSVFKGVPGLGPKIAKRIVMEMKSKVDWADVPVGGSVEGSSIRSDLLAALEQLGYENREVHAVLSDMDLSDLTLEEAVKIVLQKISR